MFKITYLIKKKDTVSDSEFRQYWLGEHADLTRQYAGKIGLRKIIKCEVLKTDPATHAVIGFYDVAPIRYDFVDHWEFNNIEELKKGSHLKTVQKLMQKAYDSEDKYVVVAVSNVQMNVDYAQFFPADANEVRATEGSSYKKIFYVIRIHDHLTRQQAQLHWNACHGGESRQHIHYSTQKKYIQAHAIDSTFVDELVTKRGYEVDPMLIGQAEGWIDPLQAPAWVDQADAARISTMTIEDIDLFSNKKRGNVFFTREHYVLDEVVVTRSDREDEKSAMPSFFSAVY
jgi:hypothetical protein